MTMPPLIHRFWQSRLNLPLRLSLQPQWARLSRQNHCANNSVIWMIPSMPPSCSVNRNGNGVEFEGGERSRTDPVKDALQQRRNTEVAALAGVQTFSTTAGDGTVITAKQAPVVAEVATPNRDQMAFQAMMAKMLDSDNCVSMQGTGKMGCSALAQAGLGNAGVIVADPASGREAPVQTANAFLQKMAAGAGPEVQQQQIIRRPEMTIA